MVGLIKGVFMFTKIKNKYNADIDRCQDLCDVGLTWLKWVGMVLVYGYFISAMVMLFSMAFHGGYLFITIQIPWSVDNLSLMEIKTEALNQGLDNLQVYSIMAFVFSLRLSTAIAITAGPLLLLIGACVWAKKYENLFSSYRSRLKDRFCKNITLETRNKFKL